jgi:hypothetical protein
VNKKKLFFFPPRLLLALLLCAAPAFAAPPKFEHTPPASATIGQEVTIKAVIKATGGVFDPYLWYRLVGQKSFKKISLKPGANNEYSATIPGSEVTGDLEYYLQAFDSADLAEGNWASKRNPNHLGAKAEAPKIGTLSVRSDPDGARVDIDGKVMGVSPWSGPVPPGTHLLIVTKEGYEPSKINFTMAAGVDFSLSPPLHKAAPAGPGKLTVDTKPMGARLLVDDQGQGRAPNTLTLQPGSHKITALYEGFAPATQTAEIAPAESKSVTLTLSAGDLSAARARLEKAHQSAPKDADVSLNLAQVCDAMKENPCAIEAYESFLSNAPASSYQTDVRGRLSQVRAEQTARERENQGLDFVTEGNEQYTVEVRSAEGVARCDKSVATGRNCRLHVPAGRAQVIVGGATNMTRDVQVPKGRSEARISKGASAAPVVFGLLFMGAGVTSYFIFDSKRQVNDPFTQQKEAISPVAYATAGGGVLLGLILFIYGVSSHDSIDLQPLAAPPSGQKKPPVKMQISPSPGGMVLRF